MREDICLILTAAIEVKNKSIVKRNNTLVRLNDYKESLKKWLGQKSFSRVVFVENSGYPLDELRAVAKEHNPHGKKVEFLQYVAKTEAELNSTSYGELMIVKYAFDNSTLLKECNYVAQVSGRIFIKNIDKLTSQLPEKFGVVGIFENNLAYMQFNLIFYVKNFFTDYVFEAGKSTINSANHTDFERVFAKATHMAIIDDYKWYPFYQEPILDGIGGTKNKKAYGRGRWFALKGSVASYFYYKIYRTVSSSKEPHLLDKWALNPDASYGEKHLNKTNIKNNK